MAFRRIAANGAVYYILRLDPGQEVLTQLVAHCQTHHIDLATVTGIGAASRIEVGYFDCQKKEYHPRVFEGGFEITAICGTITTKDKAVYPHLHITFSDPECNAWGGHLNRAVISGTAELVISPIDGTLDRVFSEEIGLNLLKF